MDGGGGESALSEHCWWNRSQVVKSENWGWMLMYISKWKIGNLVVKRQTQQRTICMCSFVITSLLRPLSSHRSLCSHLSSCLTILHCAVPLDSLAFARFPLGHYWQLLFKLSDTSHHHQNREYFPTITRLTAHQMSGLISQSLSKD
jgi:hypothetical protein